jgi:hypothetical protein
MEFELYLLNFMHEQKKKKVHEGEASQKLLRCWLVCHTCVQNGHTFCSPKPVSSTAYARIASLAAKHTRSHLFNHPHFLTVKKTHTHNNNNNNNDKGAVRNYAKYCHRTLDGILASGASGFVPSVEEIQAYKERPPVLATARERPTRKHLSQLPHATPPLSQTPYPPKPV